MIYFVRAEGTSFVKIGFTSGPIERRLASLQTGSPYPLVAEKTLPHGRLEHEKHLHALFADARTTGEWFELDKMDVESVPQALPLIYEDGRREEPWYDQKTKGTYASVFGSFDPWICIYNLNVCIDECGDDSNCRVGDQIREGLRSIAFHVDAIGLIAPHGFSLARVCQRLCANELDSNKAWARRADLAIRVIRSARPKVTA